MARPLKIFMRGKNVAALQVLLQRMGYPMHDQSRQFGASTRDAVKSFQRQHGLSPTGQVDAALFAMMQGKLPSIDTAADKTTDNIANNASSPPINQQQWDALIHLLIQKNIISHDELQQAANSGTISGKLQIASKPLL